MMIKCGMAALVQNDTNQKSLERICGMDVQLVFRPRGFAEVKHDKIMLWLEQFDITPISIHYPTFQGSDENFLDNLRMLRDAYGQRLFTVHPKFESYDDAVNYLRQKEEEISRTGIVLAYENMPGPKKRWNTYPANIAALPGFTSITYDVTHLHEYMDAVEEAGHCLPRTRIVHLSNVLYNNGRRKDHLPIDEGERNLEKFLKFLKHEYEGQIIVEYSRLYRERMKEDVARVRKMVGL